MATLIESEWIVLGAIVEAGLMPADAALRASKLTLGQQSIMKKCSLCGHLYFSICPDCEFLPGKEEEEEDDDEGLDLLEQITGVGLRPDQLETVLRWMGLVNQ